MTDDEMELAEFLQPHPGLEQFRRMRAREFADVRPGLVKDGGDGLVNCHRCNRWLMTTDPAGRTAVPPPVAARIGGRPTCKGCARNAGVIGPGSRYAAG